MGLREMMARLSSRRVSKGTLVRTDDREGMSSASSSGVSSGFIDAPLRKLNLLESPDDTEPRSYVATEPRKRNDSGGALWRLCDAASSSPQISPLRDQSCSAFRG